MWKRRTGNVRKQDRKTESKPSKGRQRQRDRQIEGHVYEIYVVTLNNTVSLRWESPSCNARMKKIREKTFRAQEEKELRTLEASSYLFRHCVAGGVFTFFRCKLPSTHAFRGDKHNIQISVIHNTKIQYLLFLIGNRKGDCAWELFQTMNTTWKSLKIAKHKSVGLAKRTPCWFLLTICRFLSGCVYHLEQPHTRSSFLFLIVGIRQIRRSERRTTAKQWNYERQDAFNRWTEPGS